MAAALTLPSVMPELSSRPAFLLTRLRVLMQEFYPQRADFRDDELANRLGLFRFQTTARPTWTAYRRIFLAAHPTQELAQTSRRLDIEMADLDLLGLWQPIAQPLRINTSVPLLPPAMNDNSPAARLIQEFVQQAIAHAEATRYEESRQATGRLAGLYRELHELGPEGRAAVLELTAHAHPGVRLWAAVCGLDTVPARCVAVLETLTQDAPEQVRTGAALTLREWRAGRWRPP